jgi:ubiquinone/menaquinone biosynthesis C-methylase UbiE
VATVRHPIFARLYTALASQPDPTADEHRRELLEGLHGRVVEVGAGNGLNFRHYPTTVTEVVAVEPESYLRGKATEAAAQAPVKITVTTGVADALPFADGEFDGAVASLMLCSVPDQAAALAEFKRVLKPGGELRFYEHVLAEDPKLRRLQKRLSPAWPHFAGGCHLDRDTPASIAAAGFEVERLHRFPFRPCALLRAVEPHVLGVARKPFPAV